MFCGQTEMSQPIAGTLHIQVNGEPREMRVGTTVAELLQELDIRPDRVAVELNLQILDRQEFDRRAFNDGDRVEVISFIGGGTDGSYDSGVIYGE
jgi:thiamine biosynthesis protein ThiS